MNSYALELYSHSLFCCPIKQAQSRPVLWYSTRDLSENVLIKYRWISVPEIAREVSFKSRHSPLYDGLDKPSTSYAFPLGVRTFASENKLFWHNCALTYLLKHVAAIAEVDKLKGYKQAYPSNAYYEQMLFDAKKQSELTKKQFRLCNQWKKTTCCLAKVSLSEPIQKSVTALKLLEHLYRHLDHNVVLVGNCIECFLSNGFLKLSQCSFSSKPQKSEFKYLFRLLSAYLKEHCTAEPDCFMAFRLSFGRYGSLKELEPIFKLDGVPDLKSKFKHL